MRRKTRSSRWPTRLRPWRTEASAKKSKKVKLDEVEAAVPAPYSEKKKKKNDKAVEVVNGPAVEAEVVKSSKKERAKLHEDDAAASKKIQKVVENGGNENGAAVNPMAVSNFNIGKMLPREAKSQRHRDVVSHSSAVLRRRLNENNMVGSARIGQGKTLAFVLPVSESVTQNEQTKNLQRGQTPSVIMPAPTWEFAK